MDKSHLIPEYHELNGPEVSRDSNQELPAAQLLLNPSVAMDISNRSKKTRKLILCFDGTGNKFRGDDSDSNILKIFRMLDRTANDQCKKIFHRGDQIMLFTSAQITIISLA